MVNQSKKRNTLSIGTPLFIAIAVIAGVLIGQRLNTQAVVNRLQPKTAEGESTLGTGRVEEVIRFVDARYVEDVDDEVLVEKAIQGLLVDLDPHSNYIPAKRLKEVNEKLQGGFSGIGIEYLILDDTLTVLRTLDGGPSAQAGLKAGDRIIAVGDSSLVGQEITAKGIGNLLRGVKGSQVGVSVWRPADHSKFSFDIIRGRIPSPSIDVGFMLDEETGYIKINQFSATTHTEFMEKLEYMVDKNEMKDLIVDLRQNPGGYLEEATKMLNQLFTKQGIMLVYTEGKAGKNEYKTNGRPFFRIRNVVVLVDEGSASASEIFAGAIQDDDRGVIVGRRTFGKGLVQEQYDLSDGSALRLTIAKYYTPSGRSIQKPYEDAAHYNNEFAKRIASGELASNDKVAVLDSTEYLTSGGDVVYGGGGIIPDIYVPFDTSVVFLRTFLETAPSIRLFAFRYAEAHKASLTSEKDIQITKEILNQFYDYAKENGAKVEEAELPLIKKLISKDLRAYIMRYHLMESGNEQFFKIYLNDDTVLEAGKKILKAENPVAEARAKSN